MKPVSLTVLLLLLPAVSQLQKLQVQDCQIFVGTGYPNQKKYTKSTQNVPNGHKISQTVIKFPKRS
jgi:hypothetical protein